MAWCEGSRPMRARPAIALSATAPGECQDCRQREDAPEHQSQVYGRPAASTPADVAARGPDRHPDREPRGRVGAGLRWRVALVLLAALLLTGCGSTQLPSKTAGLPRELVLEARPIGPGARFHPAATGPVPGRCRPQLGPRIGVHLEVFAANRVVLIAAGIGTRPPRTIFASRIARSRCYGDLVTIDPTGLLLVRPGARVTVATLFRAWGQPLSRHRVASFTAPPGSSVSVFVNGRRRGGSPGSVPLTPHAEIVLEVGPFVPPHASYTFPPRT